jgi:hypothetical protein
MPPMYRKNRLEANSSWRKAGPSQSWSASTGRYSTSTTTEKATRFSVQTEKVRPMILPAVTCEDGGTAGGGTGTVSRISTADSPSTS